MATGTIELEAPGGERLDVFVAEQTGLTRSAAANIIKSGGAPVNGKTQKAGYMLKCGDSVSVTLPEAQPSEALPQDIPLDIVYQDADIAVINKPQGMVVHPAPGNPDGTLVNALLYCMDDISGIGGVLRPGIVHRIDKDTSGLLAIAKNDAAHAGLSVQLLDKSMGRAYMAIVCGRLPESGAVDARIGRSHKDRKKMAVVPEGRPAVTHYRAIEYYNGYTLCMCLLETGRTHQIRVHMAYIGHPVAGDQLYGGRDALKLGAQALHAGMLHLIHPASGERLTFFAPPPRSFLDALEKLRKDAGITKEEAFDVTSKDEVERLAGSVR